MIFSGKPSDNPNHPDYIPSIFPTVYRTKAHIPVPNYEGSVDKLHRRLERLTKRELAKVKAEQSKKQQEKKCRDELQESRKTERL